MRIPAARIPTIIAAVAALLAIAPIAQADVRVYFAVPSSPGARIGHVDLVAGSMSPAFTLDHATQCSGGSVSSVMGLSIDSTSDATTPDIYWGGSSRWDQASGTCTTTPSNEHGYVGARRSGAVVEEMYRTQQASGTFFSGLAYSAASDLLFATGAGGWTSGAPYQSAFTGTCSSYCLITAQPDGSALYVRTSTSRGNPFVPVLAGTTAYFLSSPGTVNGRISTMSGASTAPPSLPTLAFTSGTMPLFGSSFSSYNRVVDAPNNRAFVSDSGTGGLLRISLASDATVADSLPSMTSPYAMAVLSDGGLLVAAGPSAGTTGTITILGGDLEGVYTPQQPSGPASPGISAIWVVESPTATAVPTVTLTSGSGGPGSTLSCSDGTWASDLSLGRVSREPTTARDYAWTFNGIPVSGATTSTLTTGAHGVYACTVTAENVAGEGTSTGAITLSTLPDAPSGASAVAGVGSATVSWTAPGFDGYSTITGYTVTSTPGSRTCTTTATSCIVTGLDAGTSYAFTVVASNANGDSPASAASADVRTSTAPDAPTGVTLTRVASGTLRIAWTAPASNGGSPLTGYTATLSGGKTCSSTGTDCTISGLVNGTAYTATVVAVNAVGAGTASNTSAAAHPYGTLRATWKTSGRKVTASLTRVAGAKSYAISAIRSGRTTTGRCTAKGTRVTCTITLAKGTSTLTVIARTKAKTPLAQARRTQRVR